MPYAKIVFPTLITRQFKMSEKQACTATEIEIKARDLPLSCPMSNQRVWDAHPRVYLPIEKTGKAVCPYCDAVYTLKQE